ncbi:hypothetical protein RI129_005966 [Pyrocoelia pectoralis]|uniref:Uncharacterized protein n=1 Tax=Pyrocoelia pectoralis TaxID=417401 RepID=A0AAN7VFM1_9COLE
MGRHPTCNSILVNSPNLLGTYCSIEQIVNINSVTYNKKLYIPWLNLFKIVCVMVTFDLTILFTSVTSRKIFGMIENNNIKIQLFNDKDKYTSIEGMGKNIIKDIDTTIKKESYFEPAINSANLSVDSDTNENISNNSLDSIQSGESLIKCYIFDGTRSKDADKIAAFWKAIEEHKDIQPVQPTFNMGKGHKLVRKSTDRSDSVRSNPDEEYAWYNKLLEMKKHNMDKAALAASGQSCKMCDLTPQCVPKSQTYSAEDVDAKELIKLNYWKPQSIKKSTDETTVQETSTVMKRSNKKNPEEECRKPELLEKRAECSSNQEIKNPMKTKRRNIEEKSKITNQKTQKQLQKKEGRSPNKDLGQSPKLLHPKVADVCSAKSGQVNENHLEEPTSSLSENLCSICLHEQCVCRQDIDRQGKEFMEELRSQMDNLYKNRSDSVTDKLDSVEKNDQTCCEICDDPHVCTVMNKEDLLAGEIHLPTTIEDDYMQTIFKVRPRMHSDSDLILVETEKETRSTSAQKMKKVTYVRTGDSTLLDLGESTIVTPKMSRSVSIIGIQRHVESDDSLIVYVEPLSWYSSEIQK